MLPRTQARQDSRFNHHGLSLVEVMVAVVLLGIGTTLLGTALARATTSVAKSRLDLVAATTQQSRIEQLRALPGDRCAASLGGVTEPVIGLTERWGARAAGLSLELADTVGGSGGAEAPLRIIVTRMPCQ